jgi:hypothetical protein
LQSIVAEAERQKVELRERYSQISQKLESLLHLEQVEAQKSANQITKLKTYKSKLKSYKAVNLQMKEDLENQRKLSQKYQKKADMSLVQSMGPYQTPPANLNLTRDYILKSVHEESLKSLEEKIFGASKEHETKLEEEFYNKIQNVEQGWVCVHM